MALQAILFDMDGVLFDTETLYESQTRLALTEMGYAPTPELLLSAIGRSAKDTIQLFYDAFGEKFDEPYFTDLLAKKVEDWILTNGVPIKPGVPEFLAYLRRNSYYTAIASSSTTNVITRMAEEAGVISFFDDIVGCDQVPFAKPAPDIYLAAAKKAGLAPQNTLAIEDSFNGIKSACAAGCVTIMIPDRLPATPEMRAKTAAVLNTMHEVPAFLEAYHSR